LKLRRLLPLFAVIPVVFALSARADALPVFAHRYGLSCQACHTTVPHLNAFGQAFQAAGYRMPRSQGGTFPVAVKVQLAYSSDQQDGLPKAVVDEIELLTGGAIGSNFNYFIEQYAIDGGVTGMPRDAWLQYNGGSTHVRAGQFTLPLPVDPETERDTLSHYAVYDQTVGKNHFNFFDPRIGVDAFTGTQSFAAHFVAVQSYDRQSETPISGTDFMTFLSKRAGTWTAYAYRYQGQRHIEGGNDAFYRQGLGVGKDNGKLNVLAVVQNGNDGNAGNGTSAFSSGGFLQARYAISDALTGVGRYGRTFDALAGGQQQTVFTLIMRPARNMRFTIEDQITDHHTLNVGWLFAY
jgi:hypothetical protein